MLETHLPFGLCLLRHQARYLPVSRCKNPFEPLHLCPQLPARCLVLVSALLGCSELLCTAHDACVSACRKQCQHTCQLHMPAMWPQRVLCVGPVRAGQFMHARTRTLEGARQVVLELLEAVAVVAARLQLPLLLRDSGFQGRDLCTRITEHLFQCLDLGDGRAWGAHAVMAASMTSITGHAPCVSDDAPAATRIWLMS